MIIGKRQNSTAGHGAAERRMDAAAPKSSPADSDTAGTKMLVPQEKFHSQAEHRLNRPDASFVVHLIATAEQVPQTRAIRRASVADAMSYYDAVTKVASSGSRVMTTGLSRVA